MAALRRLFEFHYPGTVDNFTNLEVCLTGLLQMILNQFLVLRADNHNHSNPQIEGSQHLVFRNISYLLHQWIDRQYRPASMRQLNVYIRRKYSRNILYQSATSNMGQTLDYALMVNQPVQRRQIALMWLQQLFGNRTSKLFNMAVHLISADIQKNFTGQAIAIGVQSNRGQAQQAGPEAHRQVRVQP